MLGGHASSVKDGYVVGPVLAALGGLLVSRLAVKAGNWDEAIKG